MQVHFLDSVTEGTFQRGNFPLTIQPLGQAETYKNPGERQ